MSKRKLGLAILTALLCVCMAMFLVACGTQGEQGEKGEAGKDGISIESVEKVDSEGLTDTYKITYSDGSSTIFTVTNGKDGADGQTPFIGENGNWWIGSVDTGIPAKGQDGSDGEDGTDGEDGQTPFIGENRNWWIGSVDTGVPAKGENGTDGKDGISITDVDINDAGELILYFSEGEPVNLGKIVGENGQDGADGNDGIDGVGIEGATIDENGNLILSLSNDTDINVGKVKGEDGQDGTDGKDGISITGVKIENGELIIAFSDGNSSNLGNIVGADGKDGVGIDRIELDENYNLTIYLTEGEPIKLGCIRGEKGENGADGKDGKSAYELYKEKFGYDGTEEQWLIDLANGNLAVVETHTVTFDAQGGSPEPETQEVKHLGKASKPENPVKDGFLFDGWYYQGEKWSFVGYVVTEDMTLTAQWSEVQEEVECGIISAEGFEFGTEEVNGQIVQTLSKTVANNVKSYDLANLIEVSDGCTWRLYSDFELQHDTNKIMANLAEGENEGWLMVYSGEKQTRYKVNVYRRHIRNYTFQSNGETYTSGTIEEDHKLNIPETNPTNKAGYIFTHWTVDGEQVVFPYTVAVDTTFIAVFTPNNNTLHFDGNGATGQMDSIQMKTDEMRNLPALGFEKIGYHLKGWATSANGDPEYTDQALYTMGTESEYTLYAVWEANNNTLHFDGTGATGGSMDDMTIATDASANLTANGYVRAGYTFKGWSTSVGGEPEYADGATYTMGTESKYTLYAVWETNINTLHFDGNGATSGAMDDMAIATDARANLTANGYVRAGYTFKGWATSAGGEVVYADGATYTMGTESEYTLYAVWEANNNTLHFDGNGATGGSMDDMTIATDASITLIVNVFERTGYAFKGWATSTDGEVVYADGAQYTMGTESEYTLYAVWETITYKISYELHGGTVDGENPDSFVITDLPLTLNLKNASKTNNAFLGWRDKFYQEEINEITEIGDITIYAYFVEATENLEYKQIGYNSVAITGYSGMSSDVYLPSSVSTPSFLGEITSINISDNGYIERVFYDNNLTFSGNITNCSNLESITVPNQGYSGFSGSNFRGCNLQTINVATGNTLYKSDGNCLITIATNTLTLGCKNSIIPNYVTSIGSSAFSGCSGLTSIEIPSSVTSIGSYAFSDCSGLTGVYISDIEAWCNIDFYSFSSNPLSYAHSLYLNGELVTDLIIPDSVTSIGAYTFSGCSSLTSIEIPSSITSIGSATFSGCSSLTSIEIPSGVTSIGNSAFSGCTGLTSIEIPSGVTSIGREAFYDCSGLTSIEIPSSVTTIGDYAFSDCSSLTSIEIPNGVTSIGAYTFNGCSSLTSIEIPSGVTSIGSSAFSGCTGLTEIIYNAMACKDLTIDNCVFYNAGQNGDGITVTIGANVTKVPAYLFNPNNDNSYAPKIIAIKFAENSICESIGSSAFSGCSSLTSIEIPSGVTSIGNYAFRNCSGLTSVIFGENSQLTSIGYVAFYGCTSLTSIEIPSSVTSIGDSAFSGCSGLTSVIFGENSQLTSIGDSAFSGCTGLTSIELPSGVTYIRTSVFYGCINLDTLNVADGNSVYKAEGNCIIEIDTNTLVIGCKNSIIPNYVTSIESEAFKGCSSLTSIEIPSGVTSIGSSAFSGCSNLTSVIFGENSQLTSIGHSAFSGCTGLTSIDIPSSVTSIGDRAFYGCTSLTSIVIPSSVTSIRTSVFDACKSLTSIDIPSSVTSIGNSAFRNCSSLKDIEIPSGVMSIGDYAFSGCSGLTSVIFGENSQLTSIGDSAFSWCNSLTSIEIPSGVTSIGDSAFYNCSSLTCIVIPFGITSIGDRAFRNCSGLKTVFYGGGIERDWNKISIGYSNTTLTSATRYYHRENEPPLNTDGTAYNGNYWHNVDGVPTIWVKEQ